MIQISGGNKPAGDDLVRLTSEMLALFTNSFLICLVLAVVTLAIMAFFRRYLRQVAQRDLLKRLHRDVVMYSAEVEVDAVLESAPPWLTNLVGERDLKVETRNEVFPTPKAHFGGAPLKNGQFMRSLQNAAELVMAQPSANASEFLALSKGAGDDQRATVLIVDALRRIDPLLARNLTSLEDREGEGQMVGGMNEFVAQARDAVAAASLRILDDFQLSLENDSSSSESIICVFFAVGLSQLAGYAVSGDLTASASVIGLFAGLLASLLTEMMRLLERRRR